MKSILDPTFRYTPSVATNIALTFERIRRDQERAAVAARAAQSQASADIERVQTIFDTKRIAK